MRWEWECGWDGAKVCSCSRVPLNSIRAGKEEGEREDRCAGASACGDVCRLWSFGCASRNSMEGSFSSSNVGPGLTGLRLRSTMTSPRVILRRLGQRPWTRRCASIEWIENPSMDNSSRFGQREISMSQRREVANAAMYGDDMSSTRLDE
jgi:hypothetical protein